MLRFFKILTLEKSLYQGNLRRKPPNKITFLRGLGWTTFTETWSLDACINC